MPRPAEIMCVQWPRIGRMHLPSYQPVRAVPTRVLWCVACVGGVGACVCARVAPSPHVVDLGGVGVILPHPVGGCCVVYGCATGCMNGELTRWSATVACERAAWGGRNFAGRTPVPLNTRRSIWRLNFRESIRTTSVEPRTAGPPTIRGSGSGRVAGSRPERGGSKRGAARMVSIDSLGPGLLWQPVAAMSATTAAMSRIGRIFIPGCYRTSASFRRLWGRRCSTYLFPWGGRRRHEGTGST